MNQSQLLIQTMISKPNPHNADSRSSSSPLPSKPQCDNKSVSKALLMEKEHGDPWAAYDMRDYVYAKQFYDLQWLEVLATDHDFEEIRTASRFGNLSTCKSKDLRAATDILHSP